MYTVPSSMTLHHFTIDLFLDFVPQSYRIKQTPNMTL